MKLRQIIYVFSLTCALFGMAATARAEDTYGKVLVYISPQDYINSTKLWHFYYDYWFKQGPVVQPIALDALKAEYGNAEMCQANSVGNMLIWLQPKMFYNPHMGVFYGEMRANVFTGGGKPLASYVGESEKLGFLDVYPNLQVEAAYKIAMQKVLEKMKADQNLQTAIIRNLSVTEERSGCGLVALMPPASANDLHDYFKLLNHD